MNTPNLHFLQTIAPLLAKNPPVVGISSNQQVRITLGIDRQILQAHIACPTAPTSILQRNILSAIDQAQTLRHQRIQALISQYAQPTKLSLWDIEATLLALRQLRLPPAPRSVSVAELKGGWGDLLSSQLSETTLLAAAHQNYLQLQEHYKSLPDPALGIFL
jgi:hypothetical protein